MTTIPTSTPISRVVALATTETRLLLRNRTAAVSAILLPLGLGVVWAMVSRDSLASMFAAQLSFVLAMGVYISVVQTVVTRRSSGLLKRLRTSEIDDVGLLVALVAPTTLLAVAQLIAIAVIDVVVADAIPANPGPLALAAIGGLALCLTAGLATAAVTASPDRAQITTLPLTFLVMIGAIIAAVLPMEGLFQLVLIAPGGAIGVLVQIAVSGAGWGATLLPLASLVVWTILFAVLTRRWFRWEPRR